MNKKTLALAIILALPLTAMAGPGGKHGGPGGLLEKLNKDLNLSAEQKPKVESLLKEQHKKMKALHDETHEKLKQLLTPEQATKLEQIKQEQKQHWEKRGAKPGPDAEPETEAPN
ncbi:MAG: hypothetical protein WC782_13080 [Methylococcaceae bacterium]|jgi:Spy/CpxP family protein refolding chaperone